MKDRRGYGGNDAGGEGPSPRGKPGGRTLTQRLSPSLAGPAQAVQPQVSAAPAPPSAPHDDPFALHLLAPSAPSHGSDGDAGPPGEGGCASPPSAGAVPFGAELGAMFGESFAGVQVATGDRELAARGIRGAAEGESVRFADAEPARPVVAHELTHVVQQRHADVSAPAFLTDASPDAEAAAEVEARSVAAQVEAGDLRPVTITAAPAAAVQYDRDDDDKARGDAFEGTAPSYFDHNRRQIFHAIRTWVASSIKGRDYATFAEWTFPHARVSWAGDPDAIAGAIVSRLVELAEAPGGAAFRTKHLPPFWHPVDLWTVVDSNRQITEGTPGQYKDGKPIAKGPMRRNDTTHEAVAVEFVAALRASFQRMVPRFVTLADDVRPSPVDAGQLVTSAPIDRLWARVLADPALVQYSAPTGAKGEAPTPTGPDVFRDGLRPVVFEWMGSQDFKLWNVLRVTWPADATTEEVAATLYQYPGVSSVQSHNAYAITNAAPFFILPRTWASAFPEAVRWASAEHAHLRDEPTDALLSSTAFDEAALAQGADEDAHPLARKGKASRKDTERLATMLWRGSDQLDFIAERIGPWNLTPQLEAERAWVQRRAMALANETPEQIAKWAPVIEAQQRVLTEASGAIVEVLEAAGEAGIQPGAPNAGPFRRALAAYVAAVGTSHLADVARERMATAEGARQQLALVFVEGAIAEATTATEDLREAEGGSFGPGSNAAVLRQHRRGIHQQKLGLRSKMLDGQAPDADALENLTLSAGMVTVRSRATELAMKAHSLSDMLKSTKDASIVNKVAAAFDSRFDTLPAQLGELAGDCWRLEKELAHGNDADFEEYRIAHVPPNPGEPDEQRTQRREKRRAALLRAQQALASFPARHGLDRLEREALDAASDNQLAALAINVIVLIAASVATSGAAAYAGGAARGFAILRLGMSAERATMAGGAVNVAVDSMLTAAVQTGLSGDKFDEAFLENVLSNVGVRAALARFAPLMSSIDEGAAALWESGGVAAKGGVALAKGAAVGTEMITAAGVSYVAQRLVRGKQPPSDDQVTAWFIQGASMAVGRMIATRTTQLHARWDRAGARAIWKDDHPQLLQRVKDQQRLAGEVEAGGDADGAMRLLIENRKLLTDEARLLRELDADPAKRSALGMSDDEHAGFARDNAAALADTAKAGMDVLPLRLAGVEEVVPGALWAGTGEEISTAMHQARAVGLKVRVIDIGNRHKKWKVQLGDDERILEIRERPPRGDRRAPKEARALLHAKAAGELAQIRVTVAPVAGASRGSYYVTHADGDRMTALFHELDGAEVVNFNAGVLLRHAGEEWYFEFNDQAHKLHGAARASAIGAKDGGLGLPASNVSTIELWGFGGGRRIHGREKKHWTDDEKKFYDEMVNSEKDEKQKLLWAGHVGISMDGGKTIYGLTPERPEGMSRKDFERKVKDNEAFAGKVDDDTHVFDLAREMAEKHGWNTMPERSIVIMDKPEQSAILAEVLRMKGMKPGEHGLGYQFPRPDDPAYSAQKGYAAECLGNCAVFPSKVGVPIPEPTGRMKQYMPELDKWIEGDAPTDARKDREP